MTDFSCSIPNRMCSLYRRFLAIFLNSYFGRCTYLAYEAFDNQPSVAHHPLKTAAIGYLLLRQLLGRRFNETSEID